MKFKDADEVYAYLDRYLNFERKLEPTEYRLDRMQSLQILYDWPDRACKVIHVAGSKGKGSTATMIASILAESEGPVGLYTSPHLLSFTERIAIDGKPVSNSILLASAEELSNVFEGKTPEDFPGGETPTYFELLTLLGFLCFRRAACTIVVVEVGLGGRLDSTNVVSPVACAITSIELEHTELLGDTIQKIAWEKAGIIKKGVPVFTSALREEALEVIRARAAELEAPLYELDALAEIKDISSNRNGTKATISWKNKTFFDIPLTLKTPMIGKVQMRNAVLAAMLARHLGSSTDAITGGISEARLRARFEIQEGMPIVILDGAHTEDSITACADDFRHIFPGGGTLLFGCAKDKPVRPMAVALRGVFSEVIVTKPGTFKASDPAEIEAAFLAEGYSVQRIDDTMGAIRLAMERAGSKGQPLLVTGSFYLCAAAASIIDLRNSGDH
jgi:dihydrofolate synthase/folylpolyglutamate synthase